MSILVIDLPDSRGRERRLIVIADPRPRRGVFLRDRKSNESGTLHVRFHRTLSTETRSLRSSGRAHSSRMSFSGELTMISPRIAYTRPAVSSRLAADAGAEDMDKIRPRYIFPGDVASIFPHTYIHFPSTSSVRYIARFESMSVTRNLHFHGKYVKGLGAKGVEDSLLAPGSERGAEERGDGKFLSGGFPDVQAGKIFPRE